MAFPNKVAMEVIEHCEDSSIYSPADISKNKAIIQYVTCCYPQLKLSGKATCISFLLGAIKELNNSGLIGITIANISKAAYFNGRAGIYRFFTDINDVMTALATALSNGIKEGTINKTDLTQEELFLILYIGRNK